MISGKFDPHAFFKSAENVALNVDAGELFSLLNRTIDLPTAWSARLTTESGSTTVVQGGCEVKDNDARDVLFIRTTPITVDFDEAGIDSQDCFQCRATGRVNVSVIAERSELKAFARAVLGSHRVVNRERLGQYLLPAIRSALVPLVAGHSADSLIGAGGESAQRDQLHNALEAACFSAGLKLEPGLSVRFESAAFEQVRSARQQAARQQAEQEARRELEQARREAQGGHLDHLASMLDRLEQLASQSPHVGLQELLRTFSEKERGEIYTALFSRAEPATRTRWIVVAAGNNLLFFDPNAPGTPQRRLTIDGSAGPIRSLQMTCDEAGRTALWLGGAVGVYRLPLEDTQPNLTLLVPNTPKVRGGFNAVADVERYVFASHSELGIYRWTVDAPAGSDAPSEPKQLFESQTCGVRAIRAIQRQGDNIYCSLDDRVIAWPIAHEKDQPTLVFTGSRSTITALCPIEQGLFAGNSEGDVLQWSLDVPSEPQIVHHGSGRPVESLWQTNTQGIQRLIFCDTSMAIKAKVIGDHFTYQYDAGGQTLRRVELAPDRLVATNDLRDRLFLWPVSDADKPATTIAVSSLCGHSIQDVCLIPSRNKVKP